MTVTDSSSSETEEDVLAGKDSGYRLEGGRRGPISCQLSLNIQWQLKKKKS